MLSFFVSAPSFSLPVFPLFFPHPPYPPRQFYSGWSEGRHSLFKNIRLLAFCVEEINDFEDPEENHWFCKDLIKSQQSKAFSPLNHYTLLFLNIWADGKTPSLGPPPNTASWAIARSMFMPHLEHKPSFQASLSGAATNYGSKFFSNFELQFWKWNKSGETCYNWWKSMKIPLRFNT